MEDVIELHKEIVDVGPKSYTYKYQTINGVKCGAFSKTYRELIKDDAEAKFIYGEYYDGVPHNKYLVYYEEYNFVDDHSAQETYVNYTYNIVADITFNFGQIISHNILFNGQNVTKESDMDEHSKKVIISLLDLDDVMKDYFYTILFNTYPDEILPNTLNRYVYDNKN